VVIVNTQSNRGMAGGLLDEQYASFVVLSLTLILVADRRWITGKGRALIRRVITVAAITFLTLERLIGDRKARGLSGCVLHSQIALNHQCSLNDTQDNKQ